MSRVSGSCNEDEGGEFVIIEQRPEGSEEPPVVASGSGRVLWVDSGSGPGFSLSKEALRQLRTQRHPE